MTKHVPGRGLGEENKANISLGGGNVRLQNASVRCRFACLRSHMAKILINPFLVVGWMQKLSRS